MVVVNSDISPSKSASGSSASGSNREGSLAIEIEDEREVDDDAVDSSSDARGAVSGSIISGTTMVLDLGTASPMVLDAVVCFLLFFVLGIPVLVISLTRSFPRLRLSFDLELFDGLVDPLASAVLD